MTLDISRQTLLSQEELSKMSISRIEKSEKKTKKK
jgi:hypothetical protein